MGSPARSPDALRQRWLPTSLDGSYVVGAGPQLRDRDLKGAWASGGQTSAPSSSLAVRGGTPRLELFEFVVREGQCEGTAPPHRPVSDHTPTLVARKHRAGERLVPIDHDFRVQRDDDREDLLARLDVWA